MQRHLIILVTLFCFAATGLSLAGELIDGIVATVNRRPILRSEWDETVRFEAFMRQKALTDLTQSERAAALQRLIDRALLSDQMPEEKALRPSQNELNEDVAKLRDKFGVTTDDGRWQTLMRSYGLNEAIIAAHLKDELQMMNFIEAELRHNVHVQDAEVQAYYESQLVPDLKENGAKQLPLERAAPNIRELLVQQHMDEMLDAWLHNLRQQSHVETMVPLPTVSAQLASPTSKGGQ